VCLTALPVNKNQNPKSDGRESDGRESDGRSEKARAFKFKAALLALIASVTLAWTFMTPFGGVADEGAYSIYANVVASGQGFGPAVIPEYIDNIGALTCHAFKPEVTAACVDKTSWESLSGKPVTIGSDAMISGYPEPYFWVVGQPSRALTGYAAVYAMRFTAWAIGMVLMALMIIFWPASHKVSLAIAALLVTTPMVGSFMGAVNPNGFEIIAGFALAGLLAGFSLRSDRDAGLTRNRVLHLVAILVAMLSLSVAKPYSYLYTVIITFAFLLVSAVIAGQKKWSQRSNGQTGGQIDDRASYSGPDFLRIAGMLGISLVVGYLANETYRNVMDQRGTKAGVTTLFDSGWIILVNFTNYAQELIGLLGWRDHAPPTFVLLLWSAAIVAFVIYVLMKLTVIYRVLLVGFVIGMLLVVPAYSNKALGLLGGAGFQTRYVGALFCALPFIAIVYLLASGRPLESLPAVRLAPALVCWFFVFQVSSLAWSFLRYAVVYHDIQWVPTYWGITLLALAGFLVSTIVLWQQLRNSNRTAVTV